MDYIQGYEAHNQVKGGQMLTQGNRRRSGSSNTNVESVGVGGYHDDDGNQGGDPDADGQARHHQGGGQSVLAKEVRRAGRPEAVAARAPNMDGDVDEGHGRGGQDEMAGQQGAVVMGRA